MGGWGGVGGRSGPTGGDRWEKKRGIYHHACPKSEGTSTYGGDAAGRPEAHTTHHATLA